jgi:hypothetical protein
MDRAFVQCGLGEWEERLNACLRHGRMLQRAILACTSGADAPISLLNKHEHQATR